MRHTLLAAALLSVMLPMTARAADTDKELARLSIQITDALVKSDAAFLDSALTDDWMVITADGSAVEKAQHEKEWKDGTLKYLVMDKSELKVPTYGDTGVVTGRIWTRMSFKGQEFDANDRFTEVYARRDGKWRCVSVQVTRIAPPSVERR
jgi:hypothetical protein